MLGIHTNMPATVPADGDKALQIESGRADFGLIVLTRSKGTRICGTVNSKRKSSGYAGEFALYVADYNGGMVALIDDAAEQPREELITEAKTLP